MSTMDFWSIAMGFAAAAPLGLLAIWAVERRERRRIPKWAGLPKSPEVR
jgi:hypothetical protein